MSDFDSVLFGWFSGVRGIGAGWVEGWWEGSGVLLGW